MPCGEAWTAASCHSIRKIHGNRNQHAWIAYLQKLFSKRGGSLSVKLSINFQTEVIAMSLQKIFAAVLNTSRSSSSSSAVRALDIMWCLSFVEKTCSSFVWSGNMLKWTSGMLCRYLGFWGIVAVCKDCKLKIHFTNFIHIQHNIPSIMTIIIPLSFYNFNNFKVKEKLTLVCSGCCSFLVSLFALTEHCTWHFISSATPCRK